MKKFSYSLKTYNILIGIFLFLNSSISAQDLDNSPLFDHPIPGRLLLDLATIPGSIENYSIKANPPISTFSRFVDGLLQLQKMGPMGATPPVDSFLNSLGRFSNLGYVPLAVLDIHYSHLDTTAYNNGLIHCDTFSRRLEFATNPSSYLRTDTAMLVYVPYELQQGWNTFILPSELIYSNLTQRTITVDFGDGNGYRGVAPDVPIPIYYEDEPGDTSEKYVLFKFEDRWNHDDVHPVITARVRRDVILGPDKVIGMNELPDACLKTTDPLGVVKAYIRYGANNKTGNLLNPVVFIEGFDIDANPADDRFGSMGWNSLITGRAFDENGRPTRQNIKDITELVQRLYDQNYDLIYVDFRNGADDLFANGNAVMKVLKWVELNTTGEPGISVIGASMGGLLARYAIRRLELEQCISCIKLYATFDSPHQGANIPLSVQHAVSFLKDESADALAGYHGLMSKAAQQMLIYHMNPSASQIRDQWQHWLDANGHPTGCKKIALTNGSPTGLNAGFDAGDKIYAFRHKFGGVEMFKLNLNAVPDCENSSNCDIRIFEGLKPVGSGSLTQYLNRLFGIKCTHVEVYSGYTLPLDNASGGQGNWLNVIDLALRKFLEEKKPSGESSFSSHNKELTTFIPTYSALDIRSKWMYPDLEALYPQRLSSANHPFDAIFYPELTDKGNQEHVFIDKRQNQNIDWIMDQLNQSQSQIPVSIPESGLNIFNSSGRIYPRYLQNSIVSGEGILHLNAKGPDGFQENNSGETFPLKRAQYRSHPCGTRLKFQDGATFILGESSKVIEGGAIAEFYLEKGEVELSNSSLILFDSSVLRIGKEARFILGAGNTIQLNGRNSKLIIEGTLILREGAVFKPQRDEDHSSGQVVFVNPGANTLDVTGTNCEIRSEDDDLESGVQWVVKSGVLTIPPSINVLAIENSTVELMEGAKIDLQCQSNLKDVAFSGDKTQGSGLLIKNETSSVQVQNCVFEDLDRAILVSTQPDRFTLNSSEFRECGIGVQFENAGWKILNCQFLLNDHAVFGISGEQPNVVTESSFESNNVGMFIADGDYEGITSAVKNSFYGNSVGVEVEANQSLLLGCNQFEMNSTGIDLHDNSTLFIDKRSPDSYEGGGNFFRSNNKSIVLRGSNIYLEGGGNNFIQESTGSGYNFITGTIPQESQCITDNYQIKSSSNYWHPAPASGNLTSSVGYIHLSTTGGTHPVQIQPTGQVLGSPNSECLDSDGGDNNEQGKSNIVNRSNQLLLYPNPSDGSVFFKFEGDGILGRDSILSVFDLDGKRITELIGTKMNQNQLKWDLPEYLNEGYYLLKMRSGNPLQSKLIYLKRN